MLLFDACVFTLILISYFDSALSQDIHDADLTIVEIFKKYGYPIEEHEVVTEDGYILMVHRIPYGKNNNPNGSYSPVILMHGLMGSSENFIIAGSNNSLAYLLPDEGYDVWLPNARGNYHSRKHQTLDPDKDVKFWMFSWHEIGKYDVPAVIDYVLNTTGKKSVYYAGHSQGTTTFFVMASERPEYQNKVKLSISLAPSVYLSNLRHPVLRLLAPFYRFWEDLVMSLNANEFIPFISNEVIKALGKTLCNKRNERTLRLCANILYLLSGNEPEQLERDAIPLIMATSPAGASARQTFHYAQAIMSGEFQFYDHGKRKNKKKYGTKVPPKYNITNVTTPVALYFAENDMLDDIRDVHRLSETLPNVVKMYKVPYKSFTHFDFLWAKDIVPLLYKDVIYLIKSYNDL